MTCQPVPPEKMSFPENDLTLLLAIIAAACHRPGKVPNPTTGAVIKAAGAGAPERRGVPGTVPEAAAAPNRQRRRPAKPGLIKNRRNGTQCPKWKY